MLDLSQYWNFHRQCIPDPTEALLDACLINLGLLDLLVKPSEPLMTPSCILATERYKQLSRRTYCTGAVL